jgi:hypothetical protein
MGEYERSDASGSADFSGRLQLVEQYLDKPDEDLGKNVPALLMSIGGGAGKREREYKR